VTYLCAVDGLFLDRFAHDVNALRTIVKAIAAMPVLAPATPKPHTESELS
jgi:hypothetical protein